MSVVATSELERLLAERKRRRMYELYRLDPFAWRRDVLGEDPDVLHWSKYEGYKDHIWDGDKDPLRNAWLSLVRKRWVGLTAATGCHAKGQKVLMYDGSLKSVEDVVVGDLLMGDDSTPRKVLELYRGSENMVRITPVKGKPFVVNESHILSLKCTGKSYRPHLPKVVNISVKDYKTKTEHFKHLYKQYRTGVSFTGTAMPYDAYFLGLWLGDGTATSTAITNIDPEIIDYIKGYAHMLGFKYSKWESVGKTPAHVITYGAASNKNPIGVYLRSCVVGGEKRIPKEYLLSVYGARMRLLAGLIDSDGSRDYQGFEISTIYEGLAEDIAFLARSLGFMCNVSFYGNAFKGAYRLNINGEGLEHLPILVPRKQVKPRKQKKNVLLTGFSIEDIGVGDYYGFELDGNHLYLLDDFTVTHNTGKTYELARMMLWFLDTHDDSFVITTAPKESQLKQNLWGELSVVLDQYKKHRPNMRLKTLNLKPEGNNEFCSYGSRWEAIGVVSQVGAEEQSATKYQGYHRKDMLIICEEAAAMHPAVMNAIENTCSDGDNNIIICAGNPDSELDELHRFCSFGMKVDSYRISALDHPNVVLKKSIFGGAVTQASIDVRKEKFGELSPLFLSRVRGITPTEGDNNLIKSAWINECTTWHDSYKAKEIFGHDAVGVDVANSEDGDKASTAWGKSNRLVEVYEFQCPNASDLATNLVWSDERIHEYNEQQASLSMPHKIIVYGLPKVTDYNIREAFIGVDAVGVGVSTVNQFLTLGMTIQALQGGGADWEEALPLDEQEKPLYEFANLRSQMFWELREDLRLNQLVIELTGDMWKAFKREAVIPKFKVGSRITIESKDNIKKRLGGKSPNILDAVAYWNWVRKGYRAGSTAMLPMG